MYEPDLFIVYTGQNVFQDARFHYWELKRSPVIAHLMKFLFKSRLFYLAHEGILGLEAFLLGPRITSFGALSVDRLLGERFSPNSFRSWKYYTVPQLVYKEVAQSSKPERRTHESVKKKVRQWAKVILRTGYMKMPPEEVYANFRKNIIAMIEAAQSHGVPIIFVEKAQNPKETNLFSQPTAELSVEYEDNHREAKWRQTYARAVRELEAGQYLAALSGLKSVQELIPAVEDGLLPLYLGETYEGLGKYQEAREEYEKRFREDHLRLNEILKEVVAARGIPTIDAYQVLVQASKHGVVGYENFFTDRVHMTT